MTIANEEIPWGAEIEDELIVHIDRVLEDAPYSSITRLVGTVVTPGDEWDGEAVVVHADTGALRGLFEELDHGATVVTVRSPRWAITRIGF